VQVQVVAEATLLAGTAHARLTRVYLPRVEIEDERTPLHPVYPTEPPLGERVGEEAEIPPPGYGNSLPGD